MDQRPKMNSYILKLLEENIRVYIHDLGVSNSCLDMTPKSQVTKGKIDILGIIKIHNFCVSKNTIKKVKTQNRRKYLQII